MGLPRHLVFFFTPSSPDPLPPPPPPHHPCVPSPPYPLVFHPHPLTPIVPQSCPRARDRVPLPVSRPSPSSAVCDAPTIVRRLINTVKCCSATHARQINTRNKRGARALQTAFRLLHVAANASPLKSSRRRRH